jgi:MFS transporter, YNFM family, putative membrane transport protein
VPLGGTLIFAGFLGIVPLAWSALLEAGGACLLIYALAAEYRGLFRRPTAPLVLGTVMIEGLFVFGGLAYLASSLTDRFGVNYAYAGLMVAGFGCGGLVYSATVKKLVAGIGELGVLLLGGTLLGAAFVFIGLMPSWHWFVPAVVVVGMGYYTMHGTLQTRATELAPQTRGAAISLFAFFFFLGQALGPQLLGSVLKSYGYAAVFIAAGAGLATTAAVARTLFMRAAGRAL